MNYDNVIKLTNKEILNYLKLYQEGDINSRSKIIVGCIPLVKEYVSKHYNYSFNTNLALEDLIEIGLIGVMKAIENYDFSKGNKFFYYATYYIDNEITRFASKEKKKNRVISYDEMLESLNNNNLNIVSNFDVENIYFSKEIIEVMKKCLSSFEIDVQDMIRDYFGIDRPKMMLIDIAPKHNISNGKASKIIAISLYHLRLEMNKKEYYGVIK